MKSEKFLIMAFVLGIVLFSAPAIVYADENETSNTTANVTANVTTNTTINTTANVTTNITTNVTTNTTANVTANVTNITGDFNIKIISPQPKNYYDDDIKVKVKANRTVDSLYLELDGKNWTCKNCSELEEEVDLNEGNYSLKVRGTLDNVTKNASLNFRVILNEDDDDDENESDEVNVHDVILGKTNHGMEVRLLQLYKSLTRNVEHGQMILEEINDQNFSVDTDDLNEILDEAIELNDKISDLLEEEPVNVSTEKFVSLKAEAINLTFQFKRELYNILAPEQLNEIKSALREEFKDSHSGRLSQIDNMIRNKIRMHNFEQAMKMYNKFGFNNPELKEIIQSENFSSKELKDYMKDEFKEMEKNRKQDALKKMKEERENYQKEKMSISGKRMGVSSSEIENILNNNSLTWEEKEAKLRILAQERSRVFVGSNQYEDSEDDDFEERDNDEVRDRDRVDEDKDQDGNGKGFGGRR